MTVTIRPARLEDAAAIKRVHVQSWQQTYAHLLPADFLQGLDDVIRIDIWESNIADDSVDVFIAESDGVIIGWAKAGTGQGEDATRGRELAGLYVLGGFHGTGVGRRLLEAVIGDAPAYLWVAEGNPRAEAFYTKHGFVRDGARKLTPFADEVIETVHMVRTGLPSADQG